MRKKLPKSAVFCLFLVFFIGGTGFASFFSFANFFLYLFFLLAGVLALFFWGKPNWRWLFLAGIFLVAGIWRYQLSLPHNTPGKIWFYNGQKINFEGAVASEPDIRINHTKLVVAVRQLTIDGKSLTVGGKVLVSVNLYPEYYYGDLVSVFCQLNSPQSFSGFAYDRYLAKDGIYSQCFYPKVKLISSGHGNFLLAEIFKFKNKLQEIINYNLPEPQASLFNAIILGARRGLPVELSEAFSLTGTTHLIAISGMNITLIIVILTQLLLACYIPRKKTFWLITIMIVGYIIMVGFSASAVRAAIMGWLVLLAMQVGRLNRSSNALLFTASLMILINPKILRDDVGFQLSFCAVLGLIYFAPLFDRWLKNVPSYLGLKESLQMTLSAQIATLPLIVFNFGRISLIGLVVNLLVIPTISYLMIIGLAALFISLFFPSIAPYLFWPVWLILTYLIKVVEIFSVIPGAAINL